MESSNNSNNHYHNYFCRCFHYYDKNNIKNKSNNSDTPDVIYHCQKFIQMLNYIKISRKGHNYTTQPTWDTGGIRTTKYCRPVRFQ